ncbi:ATP-binding protein [Bacillus benzoevorans]|uniref:histidine kinase n=1 Tax=Bacillus benzoevorans TaxID=1456 RepID=A0A7X0HW33_9BACI|nr:sensor histidine kinase [Bacillus benzoevorans]MBB6447949.1 two-component system sporulation sensor kinase B [Bacillus benzoevorans]
MKDQILFLFNHLLFVLVMVFIYQFWLDRKERTFEQKRMMHIIFSTICVIFCMSFTVTLTDEFIVDLRQIPMLIAALYGGVYAAIPLAIITVGYRFIIGGAGIVGAVSMGISIIIISLIFSKRYLTWSIRKKVIWSMLLALYASSLVLTVYIVLSAGIELLTNGLPEKNIIYIFGVFIIFHVAGTGIATYAFEKINSFINMKQRIIQTEKIELISHLAASISHEVRNPLTVSRGFMQLLLEDSLKDKKNEYASIAINELDRAERIITDYLTFAKPIEERQEIFDVRQECLHVIEVIRPLANMNAVEVTTHLTEAYTEGSRQSFQQCLLNITKNGIEAIEDGGALHIELLANNKHITLLVRDTGKGMTEEQMKRLGEPYFTTKGAKGTGLGMMVSYGIIHSMNGSIKVTSELGKGTCFEITLPRKNENEQE